MADKFIKVTTRQDDDGCVSYLDPQGVVVAVKMPWYGRVADVRSKPTFHAMSPCPYCSTHNDRQHDPLKHTDPFLGEKLT